MQQNEQNDFNNPLFPSQKFIFKNSKALKTTKHPEVLDVYIKRFNMLIKRYQHQADAFKFACSKLFVNEIHQTL